MAPQLIKAELLANFRIKLTFDNNEIRFLGTKKSNNFIEENNILKNIANCKMKLASLRT